MEQNEDYQRGHDDARAELLMLYRKTAAMGADEEGVVATVLAWLGSDTHGRPVRSEEWDTRTALLGHEVDVTLCEDPAEPKRISSGVLLGFDEGGEVQVLGDDGFVWYGWPALKIEPRDPHRWQR